MGPINITISVICLEWEQHEHYTAGDQKIMIEYKGCKVCSLVCYDLRFPVWSRNTKADTYDVLIYVANWPEVRSYLWQQLIVALAIENQAYVVGVNRIGEDGNHVKHSGDSVVLNPRGETISHILSSIGSVETTTLSCQYLRTLDLLSLCCWTAMILIYKV